MNTKTLLNRFAAHIKTEVPYDDFQKMVADAVIEVVGKADGKWNSRKEINFLRKCGLWSAPVKRSEWLG